MKQSFVVGLPFGTRLILTTDLEAALRQVEVRQQRLEHPGPLLYMIAGIMRADARQQFAEGGDPAWKALTPSTIAAKTGAGLPAKTAKGRIPTRLKQNGSFGAANILIATGVLRDSYGRKDSPHHIENINEAAGTVDMGSNVSYASVHQTGSSPYPISPKAGKVLAFMGVKGKVVTNKPVQHPGLAARPVVITGDARRKIVGAVGDFFAEDAGASTNRSGSGDYDYDE